MLKLSWQESGGPPVDPPDSAGYGSKVIAASARQLGGTTSFDWQSAGLRFAMSMMIGDAAGGQDAASNLQTTHDFEPSDRARPVPDGGHILLVEDEAFVAMMMKDLLAEFGFRVVGPFGKVADAIETLDRQHIVGAVLDVNLAGEKVYPLAEQLSGRGIPFVFVTGYACDAIDDRFAGVPRSAVTAGATAGVSTAGGAALAAPVTGLMGAAGGGCLTLPSAETARSAVPAGAAGRAADGLDAVSGTEPLTGPGGATASAVSARARSPPCLGNSTMAPAAPVMIPNAAAASPTRTFCRSWREGQR
jgi:CheY-like chemotaxis protein